MAKATIDQVAYLAVCAGLVIITFQNQAWAQQESNRPTWATTEAHGQWHKTSMQFYFHDNTTGDSVTAVQVVPAPGSHKLLEGLGAIVMTDDPLTVGTDPRSKLVGRAQGLYGRASREDHSLIFVVTLNFMDGMYEGSTLSILAHNMVTQQGREFPVVGGTGIFRMARGYALAYNYFFNMTSLNAIVGYNVTVFH